MAHVPSIQIFSTCPHSAGSPGRAYADRVADVARWSEDAGCTGILVYSDNSSLDPWLLSHLIIQRTTRLCPLVAVQPVYMHPYWVAKQIASLGHIHERRVYLNMVAGGFKNDLEALDDRTPHDQRYQRLVEYTTIVMQLLGRASALTFEGRFHRVSKLKLAPPLPAALIPGVFVSGSSDAGVAAARALGATAVKYPKPAAEEAASDDRGPLGIRVGIIARHDDAEAWRVARARFPVDRKGELTRQLASKVSDSAWHRQLSDLEAGPESTPYWLVPFQSYQTMCPYLVGSYDVVAAELARYFRAGYRTVILDVPPNPDELGHACAALDAAMEPAL